MTSNWQPALSSNFSRAQRPVQLPIQYIVLHATELSYGETVARFQSEHHVSAHVVVRQQDGLVTQMVAPQNIAWHAGNWDMNCRSLGIEQEAFVADETSFTSVMLDAVAQQVNAWSRQFRIPIDRAHILGHDNVPAPSPDHLADMHQDPGGLYDWRGLFERLGLLEINGAAVQIGQALQASANAVPLLTAPTGEIVAQQLHYGQQFVCADLKGDWVAIWHGGRMRWLNNRDLAVFGVTADVLTITEKCPVYGSTQPDAVPIDWLKTGQQYVISATFPGMTTDEVAGHVQVMATNEQFMQIWYGQRIGYVKIFLG